MVKISRSTGQLTYSSLFSPVDRTVSPLLEMSRRQVESHHSVFANTAWQAGSQTSGRAVTSGVRDGSAGNNSTSQSTARSHVSRQGTAVAVLALRLVQCSQSSETFGTGVFDRRIWITFVRAG